MYQEHNHSIGTKTRELISNIYRQSDLGYLILRPFYKLYEIVLAIIPDKIIVKSSFKKHMGYDLDLKNPLTLNEKINWLKLYNRKDIQTLVSDKYRVRDYIASKIGNKYLIPLIFHTDNYKDLVPENLPESNYIIKTNHDSSGGLIVKNSNKLNYKEIQKRFRRLMKENHYYSTKEWQYKNIKPHIIVEKLLLTEDGDIPSDYKFHCFNGKVEFIMVDLDRFGDLRTRNLYDKDWNLLECKWGRPNGKPVKKPNKLNEMIEIAEKLATKFIYLRVDLYYVKEEIYFGELTLYHASGFQAFLDPQCDLKFGKLLKLGIENE